MVVSSVARNLPRAVLLSMALFSAVSTYRFSASLREDDVGSSAARKALEAMTTAMASGLNQEEKDKQVTRPVVRKGVVVLGMHRSGTSMLSGLLGTAGYNVGADAPLIGAGGSNAKGHFERIDAVRQNDVFLFEQNLGWDKDVLAYDPQRALDAKNNGTIPFQKGATAVDFFNGPHTKLPWMQKDPRMCVTLPTWLNLMDGHEPAVLFTYRHPVHVAQSLQSRNNMPFHKGLKLWIAYNMLSLKNSKSLCRVTTSNDRILAEPVSEMTRIVDELADRCRLPRAHPGRVSQSAADEFVDPKLQHGKASGDCDAATSDDDPVVRDAMTVYCDLESGKAFGDDYEWPKLTSVQ